MSKRQINVIINGTSYDVELGDLGAEIIQVSVNGKPYEVKLGAVEGEKPASEPVVQAAPRVQAAPVIQAAPVVRAAPAAKAPAARLGAENELRAPMPGTILNIAVKVGDKVARGQQVCALEAMKMKSAIRSPREGVISCVEVADGQKVAYNDLLFKFE